MTECFNWFVFDGISLSSSSIAARLATKLHSYQIVFNWFVEIDNNLS